MMNVVLKMMIFCIKNDESCIKNDDILLFKMMNFVFKMMDFVFKMMNLGKSKSCIRSSPISANARRSSTSTSASCFRIDAVFILVVLSIFNTRVFILECFRIDDFLPGLFVLVLKSDEFLMKIVAGQATSPAACIISRCAFLCYNS